MDTYAIRADYDHDSIVVYQAYSKEIALPALKHKMFVPPFSYNRMTWIKTSYLWLMERSNWGLKAGQECILAVRITRRGWEEALSQAVLTTPEKGVYRDYDDWRRQFKDAVVHVQWDPERTIHGESLDYMSIQIGLSRHIIRRYVDDWVVDIRDYTALTRKLYGLINTGQARRAKNLLPKEKLYPVDEAIAKRLGMR